MLCKLLKIWCIYDIINYIKFQRKKVENKEDFKMKFKREKLSSFYEEGIRRESQEKTERTKSLEMKRDKEIYISVIVAFIAVITRCILFIPLF